MAGVGSRQQLLTLLRRRPAHGDMLCLHLYSRTHALQAIDDDVLARGEPGLHHAQPVDDWTELHRPVLDLAAGADHQHVTYGLIRADSTVVHEHGIVLGGAEEPHACEQSRGEETLVVVEHRAAAN